MDCTRQLDKFPPELLLRIVSYAANDARDHPLALLNLTRVCRTFRNLLDPSNATTERTIWKPAAQLVYGEDTEIELRDCPTNYSWYLRHAPFYAPPPPLSRKAPSAFRTVAPTEWYFTSRKGPAPPLADERSHEDGGRYALHARRINTCPLPPLMDNTTRTYDFLHTCTEASVPVEGFSYMSSAPHSADFIFNDDPRTPWFYPPEDPYLFGRGRLKSGPGHPLEKLPSDKRPKDFASRDHYLAWARQSVHSDSDLILEPGAHYTDIASVRNIENGNTWDLRPLELGQLNFEMDCTYEVRSCGPYLSLCEKVGGMISHNPILICIHTDGTFWAHYLPLPEPSLGITNSAFRMNTSFVAVASRSFTNIMRHGPQMRIYIFSTSSGELMRTLELKQENATRMTSSVDEMNLWCSLAMSETHIIGTVGAYNDFDEGECWQYRELFMWDLRPGAPNTPVAAARLPSRWDLKQRTFLGLSRDGTRAYLTHGWDLAVWNMITKRCMGLWTVPHGRTVYDLDESALPRGRDTWWNGMWIGYRDIDSKTGATVATGVGYFVADVFREFFTTPEKEWDSDPEATSREDFMVWKVSSGVWGLYSQNRAGRGLGSRPYHRRDDHGYDEDEFDDDGNPMR